MGVVQRRAVGVVVLGLAVATGVYLLRREANQRDARAQLAVNEAHLVRCPVGVVWTELRLRGPQGTLTLRRVAPDPNASADTTAHELGDGAWQLWPAEDATPVPADASTVRATLQATCELAQLGNALALPADANLADFGLNPPRHTLQLRDANDAAQTLEAGNKSPFDGSLYVRRGAQDAVRRVDGAFAFQLERDAFALRDKRLLRLEPRALQSVRLEPGAHQDAGTKIAPFTLTRTPEGQLLAARGRQELADPAAAQGLLAAVAQLQAQRFVADAPDAAARARFGLTRPHLLVHVGGPAGVSVPVRFGRLTLGGEVHHFVQAGAETSPIAELPSAWVVEKLERGADELRDMRVLALEPDAVGSFTVTDGHGAAARTLRFARHGDPDVPMGRQAFVAEVRPGVAQAGANANAPAAPGAQPVHNLDVQRVATTLNRLCALRADRFDDAPADAARRRSAGVEPPAVQLVFEGADGETLATLALGPEHDNHRAAFGPRRPELAHVFAAALSGVDADPASWQAAPEVVRPPATP